MDKISYILIQNGSQRLFTPPITVLTAKWWYNRHTANSGYRLARASVLGPNMFYINTKRFTKIIEFPHNGINRQYGSKNAIYLTLAIDKLELQFFGFHINTKRFRKVI